jgi:rubredoxin
MAESAYRDAVAEAGSKQTKLTEGWKVLGLDKETATRIYEETKSLGFLNRQELWKKEEEDLEKAAFMEEERRRQALKDSIDKEGNLIDPNAEVDPDKLITDDDLNKKYEEDEDDEDGESAMMGQTKVKECGKCKYTLFIAAGREKRFFPSGFICPQCGAPRDQFKDVEIDA